MLKIPVEINQPPPITAYHHMVIVLYNHSYISNPEHLDLQ